MLWDKNGLYLDAVEREKQLFFFVMGYVAHDVEVRIGTKIWDTETYAQPRRRPAGSLDPPEGPKFDIRRSQIIFSNKQ